MPVPSPMLPAQTRDSGWDFTMPRSIRQSRRRDSNLQQSFSASRSRARLVRVLACAVRVCSRAGRTHDNVAMRRALPATHSVVWRSGQSLKNRSCLCPRAVLCPLPRRRQYQPDPRICITVMHIVHETYRCTKPGMEPNVGQTSPVKNWRTNGCS